MNKKTGKLIINKHHSAGYTLIELLMVMALAGFVGSMILGSLVTSKNLFKDTANKTEAIQQIRHSMSMIYRDVQNVVRSSDTFIIGLDKRIDVNGNPHHVDFLSLKLLSKKSTSDISGDNSFVVVRYFADYDEKNGLVFLKKTIVSYDNTDIKKTNVVCKNINGINFRYLKGKVWYDKWDSRLLPDAVEITLFIDSRTVKTLPDELQVIVNIIS